jgi:hypothetical protein
MIGSLKGGLEEEVWACGKDRLTEKEQPAEKNEGDRDLRSMRISERSKSEEGMNIKGKKK